jgi:hypothetical protein
MHIDAEINLKRDYQELSLAPSTATSQQSNDYQHINFGDVNDVYNVGDFNQQR